MALGTQIKLMRAMRRLLLESGGNFFVGGQSHRAACPPSVAWPQHYKPLPRSTPEAEGIASALLEKLCRDIAAAPEANPHSLLVVKNGKLVCEGHFAPFRQGVWHVTHSLCKSFTGTAVGLAIDEGLFAIDDIVADYFKDKLPLLPPQNLRKITVRHLLTMTSGISFNEVSEAVEQEWLRGIFSSQLSFVPGSRFVYNSMNSYLLAALVCRTAGMGLTEYLEARLFRPLGFGPVQWEKSPEGIEKGGWGMYLLPEDMAKLGVLYLQRGRWEMGGREKQILPEKWVEEATKTHVVGPQGEEYGYQLWTEGQDAFLFNGMFGQYVAVLPKHNLIVAMTAGNARMFTDSPAYNLVRQCLYPLAALDTPRPAAPRALASLNSTLSSLKFRKPVPQKLPRPGTLLPAGRPWGWNAPRRAAAEADKWKRLADFESSAWAFPTNRLGLLPAILQAMDNNFTHGLEHLELGDAKEENLPLVWREGGVDHALTAGLEKPVEQEITIGSETFLVAVGAELVMGDEEEPVLKIGLYFLEHSSCRQLRFVRRTDGLRVTGDELPSFAVGVESALRQNQTTASSSQSGPSLSGRLRDNDYLRYRLEQLIAPAVTGTEDTRDHAAAE